MDRRAPLEFEPFPPEKQNWRLAFYSGIAIFGLGLFILGVSLGIRWCEFEHHHSQPTESTNER
jgi:hypothetical protein